MPRPSKPRTNDHPEIDSGPGFTREKFIDDYFERVWLARSFAPSGALPEIDLDDVERAAVVAWDRLQHDRGERLSALRYYRSVALYDTDDLRTLKKRLGPRSRMTVTIPYRMAERLAHVPRGLKSATVARLLARGWLWEDALGIEEGGEE